MSIRAVDHAVSGLRLASDSLAANAHNTANQLTDGFRRVGVSGAEAVNGGVRSVSSRAAPSPGARPVRDAVEQSTATLLYRSNLAVLRAADEATGQLLDLFG